MDNDKIKRGYELIEKGYNDFIRLVEDDKNFIKYILGLSTGSIVFTITFYQGFSNSKLIIPGLIFMLLTIIVGLFGIRFTSFHIKILMYNKFDALTKLKDNKRKEKFSSIEYDKKAVILYYSTLSFSVC